jgi:hypothetical protein
MIRPSAAGTKQQVDFILQQPAAARLASGRARRLGGGGGGVSASYRATRHRERVQASVRRLRREDRHAVVLGLGPRSAADAPSRKGFL